MSFFAFLLTSPELEKISIPLSPWCVQYKDCMLVLAQRQKAGGYLKIMSIVYEMHLDYLISEYIALVNLIFWILFSYLLYKQCCC